MNKKNFGKYTNCFCCPKFQKDFNPKLILVDALKVLCARLKAKTAIFSAHSIAICECLHGCKSCFLMTKETSIKNPHNSPANKANVSLCATYPPLDCGHLG